MILCLFLDNVCPVAYDPMLIPGQCRFSLYSGAVTTEGRCSLFTVYCGSSLDLVLCLMPRL